MIKKFFKIFGIVIAAISVVMGGTVGVLAITGVFSKENVPINAISFSQPEYYIDDVESIIINPEPKNTTETNLSLKAEPTGIVNFPSSVKVGEYFKISPVKVNDINKGGVAIITAKYKSKLICTTTVYVDVPVENIDIKVSKVNNSTIDEQYNPVTTLISGTQTQLTLNYSKNSFSPYGTDYEYGEQNKLFRKFNNTNNTFEDATFSIQTGGEENAQINAKTGLVNVIKPGSFTVEAKVYKTYKSKQDYENHKLNGDFESTEWDDGTNGKVDGKTEQEYLNDILISITRSFDVRDVYLSNISVNQPASDSDIQTIYVFETLNFTYEDLGLKLYPETNSGFNTDDMKYRLNDVELVPIKRTTGDKNETGFDVSDYIINGEKVGWTITCKEFQDFSTSKTSLKFRISTDGTEINEENEENIKSTTLDIKILKNDVKSFTLKNNTPDSELQYVSNLNFFTNVRKVDDEYQLDIVKNELNLNNLTNITFEYDKPGLFTEINRDTGYPNGYVTVKYFIKDYDKDDYDNRIIDCDKETGEVKNGKVVILNQGEVQIIAKALMIDANGKVIAGKTEVKVANSTSNTFVPLKIIVKEKVTNIKIEFDTEYYENNEDEKLITIENLDYLGEQIDAIRESQTNIKLKLSAITSKSNINDEHYDSKLDTYSNKLLVEMLNNGELVLEKINIDNIPQASISCEKYNPETYEIDARLFIPEVSYVSDPGEFRQTIITNVKFKYVLSDEIKSIYHVGDETVSFTTEELQFNVVTARAENISISSNKDDYIFKFKDSNNDEHISNMLTYKDSITGKDITGYVLVRNSLGKWVTLNSETDFALNATLTPANATSPGISLDSSNTDLVQVTNSDKENYNFEERIFFQDLITNIDTGNYVRIAKTDGIDAYVEYIYYGYVKITFSSTDTKNQVVSDVYIHFLTQPD